MSRLALFIAISGLSFAATAQEPASPHAVAAPEKRVVVTGSIDLSDRLRMLDPAVY